MASQSISKEFVEENLLAGLYGRNPKAVRCPKLVHMSEPQSLGADANFMSLVYRVELGWDSNDASLPSSLVIKVASGDLRKMAEMVQDQQRGDEMLDMLNDPQLLKLLHTNECAIYNLFRTQKAPFKLPICYFFKELSANSAGYLFLEDLSGKGSCKNVIDALSLEQVFSAVECIATYHAYSITSSDWKGKCNFPTLALTRKISPMVPYIYDQITAQFPPITTMLSRDDFIKAVAYDQSMDDLEDASGKSYFPVLCHGDMWSPNLIYKKTDGTLTNELLGVIDWQVAHGGPAGEDLVRLLVTGLSAESRRANEKQILQHYLKKLGEILAAQPPFAYAELEKWYYKCMPFAAFFACFILPMVAQKAGSNPEVVYEVMMRSIFAFQDAVNYMKKA